ncbi:protoporphyrinogen oxidase [Nocardioides sp. dk4132]|uniref:protoporphyrinogen oxidase n=1 Tax=unclassified Nocardioides TaxID=2615069 RepID=UPI00129734AF|nr:MULTISPECIES: protoporphyrinogen oxidase [unclassified Nocardioides]MQW74743.1 protoporphyrinogen oxidase [Nocardioides sp. dk4132]QGA06644.1 protoporphyrinogen oxidase [Nocardioides sp. dk884]
MPSPTRVAVVGAGLAGLTAAHELTARGCEVVVLEAADRVGGKIWRTDVAGVTVDVGAEAMLHRRPEGVDLARSLGLEVEHPAVVSSRIWTRGALRTLPRSLMGVPLDLDQLAASGVLSPEGLERVRREPMLPPEVLDDDVTVGDLVARRLGEEVVDRLVEPLLGGVYAGHARLLSARAAVPQLLALAQRGSLVELGAALPSSGDGPVFAGLPGGMGRLPETLAASLDVRLSTTVRALERTGTGLRLVTGPTTAPVALDVDAVVLATPAAPTARLLADLAPAAAADLAGIEYASMAVVSLAFRAADAAALEAAGSSGFLVPPVDGRRIKAATFSFAKWGWVRRAGAAAEEPLVHLRTSLGRHREEAALQASDEELVAWSLADLAEATGFTATPVDVHVQRWGGGLPQYALGHLERVARIRAEVEQVPGLAVCGAAYDGVGIPAVVASARTAVARLVPPEVSAAG